MHSERERKVEEFHRRIGHSVGDSLSDSSGAIEEQCGQECENAALHLATLARGLRAVGPGAQHQGDSRPYRLHLMIEELSEVASAMADRNEVELADALADLQYVLSGTAVAFDIPLGEVFDEVHRSNMTKTEETEEGTGRFVGKGPGYVPPDVAGALERGRSRTPEPDHKALLADAYEVMGWLMKGIKHISVPDYGKLNRTMVALETVNREQE